MRKKSLFTVMVVVVSLLGLCTSCSTDDSDVSKEVQAEDTKTVDASNTGCMSTAVIAINDFAASGIIRSIREHGLSIPEDISIVSFDNTYIADVTLPKLTSVDYDYKNYGKLLISTAIAAANGKACKTAQMVEPKLVIRESSGPVRKL